MSAVDALLAKNCRKRSAWNEADVAAAAQILVVRVHKTRAIPLCDSYLKCNHAHGRTKRKVSRAFLFLFFGGIAGCARRPRSAKRPKEFLLRRKAFAEIDIQRPGSMPERASVILPTAMAAQGPPACGPCVFLSAERSRRQGLSVSLGFGFTFGVWVHLRVLTLMCQKVPGATRGHRAGEHRAEGDRGTRQASAFYATPLAMYCIDM